MRVLDTSTNQIVDLNSLPDSNQAIQAIVNGQAVPDANSTYDLKNIEGKPYQVTGHELTNALASGSTFFTQADAQAAQEKEQFGGVGGQTAAGALGVANGLTLGGAGLALDKTGLVPGDTQAALQRQNPITSTAGNVVGAIAPAVLSGGESTLAQALQYTPAGLVGAAGKAVTSLAAPLAESAGSMAANVAPKALSSIAKAATTKAVEMGLGSAAEGALYGGGQAVESSVIQNKPLTAEALMVDAGKGGLLGLGLGGALGGGAEVLGQGIKAGTEKVANLVGEKGEKLKANLISRALGAPKKEYGAILGNDFKIGAINDAYSAMASGEDLAGGAGFADKFKAASEKPFNLESVTSMNPETVLKKSKALQNSAGEAISSSLDQVQGKVSSKDILNALGDAKNSVSDLDFATRRRIESFADEIKNKFTTSTEKAAVVDGVGNVGPKGVELSHQELSANDLWSFRKSLDKIIFPEEKISFGQTPYTSALREARTDIENKLEGLVKDSGGEVYKDYKAAKNAYAGASDISKLANKQLEKSANNFFGPTAYLSAGAGAAMGGPVGAAAGLVGRKLVTDYGDKAALMVLSQLEKHASSLNKVVDESINGLMSASRKGAGLSGMAVEKLGGSSKEESYQNKVDNLNHQIQKIDDIKTHLNNALGSLGAAAPETATALQEKTLKALDFLSSKIPMRPEVNPLVHYQVPESEIDKFNRYAMAVEKPQTIMHNLKGGYISPEEVEVLKNVYPEIHAKLKEKAIDALSTKGKEINYQLRIQLQKLLETKADVNLYPANVKTLQQTFNPNSQVNQDQQQRQTPAKLPGSRANGLKIGSSMSSGFESTLRRRS